MSAASYRETVLAFDNGDASLMGVLAVPAEPVPVKQALIVVVGGPQYRAGSHRQFTLLARRLAAAGIAVLRFDCGGMGDSTGTLREFTDTRSDIRMAIDAVHRHLPALEGVSLWGLCDGASAALLYLDQTPDPRVCGLCLLNPWVRSEQTFARTQITHYYAQRLKQAEFWKKLLSGQVALKALREIAAQFQRALARQQAPQDTASFQQRMAQVWHKFPGRMMLVLSGLDLVAKEFLENAKSNADWTGALDRPGLQIHYLPDADHTCSNAAARSRVEDFTLAWLREGLGHAA